MATQQFCSTLTNGIYPEACALRRGGICAVYAVNVGNIDTITLTATEVTAIVMDTNPATSNPFDWFPMTVKREDGGGLQAPAIIGTNNRTVNQVLTFTVEGVTTEVKNRYEELISGDFAFIAVTAAGVAQLIGRKNGARMSTGDLGTGIAVDDLVGGTLEFTANNENEAPKTIVAGTTITILNSDGTTSTVTL